METQLEDFFVLIKKINVAHQYVYDISSGYQCPEGRKSYGFVYLLTGSLEYFFTDGRYLKVNAGNILFLKPSDGYKVNCSEKCLHYTVNFQIDEDTIEGKWIKEFLCDKNTTVLHPTLSQNTYADCLNELCSVWAEKKDGYQISALSLLYKLFYLFVQAKLPYLHNKNYLKIEKAKAYIVAHWNEPLSLAQLASISYLSISHFRHLFTEIFQLSPMEYQNSLRLLHAKDYLIQGYFSITEIAYKCGFSDVNYFSRFFKQKTGISPTAYKNSYFLL